MSISPWPHQIEIASMALPILREHMLVYLAMEERTGKTLTAILMCEQLNVERVLVITKKKALDGWKEILAGYPHAKLYKVINYHAALKETGKYDIVLLDEPHAYVSGYPKPSTIWMAVKKLALGLPIIYMSATPNAQGPMLLYHQFALSSWSPWKRFANFYQWYKYYAKLDAKGETIKKWIAGRLIETYADMRDDEVLSEVKQFFITKTRKELGFEHEPEDELHYIELSEPVRNAYNLLQKQKVLEFELCGTDYTLVADTVAKLRYALHMLEGGTLKVDERPLLLSNLEKINYIKEKWGDSPNVVIMYHFVAEGLKLRLQFQHATLLQGTSNAEGVDLHKFDHLIVYSQDYSTAKHTQRRARQANKNRDSKIKVHFLLVKKAISEQVYKTVSINKKNYVDSTFMEEAI